MSIHCMDRVWDHSKQKDSALLLLLAIASCAGDDGFACPSLAILAAHIRRSRRQTRRLVARLEDAGELLVLRQPGRGNLYLVCTGASPETLAAGLDRAVRFGAVRSGATPPSGTLERALAATAIPPGPAT